MSPLGESFVTWPEDEIYSKSTQDLTKLSTHVSLLQVLPADHRPDNATLWNTQLTESISTAMKIKGRQEIPQFDLKPKNGNLEGSLLNPSSALMKPHYFFVGLPHFGKGFPPSDSNPTPYRIDVASFKS